MLVLLFSDIPSAGRFDRDLMTDQMRMDLLFTPDDETIRAALGGDPDDACTWAGITCRGAQVVGINWSSYGKSLAGSMDFRFLPEALTDLRLCFQGLYGEIDMKGLPRDLTHFTIMRCLFTGIIDLGSLPRKLIQVQIYGDQFHDLRNVCNLPPNLEELRVYTPNIVEKTIFVAELREGDTLVINLKGCGITRVELEEEGDRERIMI